MKKIILVLGVVAIALSMFVGCQSTKNADIGNSAIDLAKKYGTPNWFFGLPDKIVDESKGIFGVGKSTLSNLPVAEKSARLAARESLASRLSIVIENAESRTEDGTSGDTYKAALKSQTNQLLVGSKQVDMWFGDIEGTTNTGVLMYMPYADLMKSFKNQAMKSGDVNMQKYLDGITIEALQDAAATLPGLTE